MIIKKPKFWDLNRPNLYAYLLFPFTFLLRIRNLYLRFKSKIKHKDIKTICVGNIYIGGTGKTPTVIKLYEILNNLNIKIKTAKKFYPSQKDEVEILNNKTNLLISNDRRKIIKDAIKNNVELLIFDDGLQDKYIDYDLKIVCFDTEAWVGNGQLIPSGPLRENLSSLKNYNCVILKNIENNKNELSKKIKKINPDIEIFNSIYKINNVKKFNLKKKYLIFSGIGCPNSFKSILSKNNFNIVKEIIFPDHYLYLKTDILEILKEANYLGAEVITTEKDMIKIPKIFEKKINFIELKLFIENEEKLLNFIKSKIYE